MIAEKNPNIAKAVEMLTVLSKDERVRAAYEAQEKARMDAISFENYAKRKGRTEGLAEGRAQGLAEGHTQAVQILKHHIAGKSAEEIATLYNLSLNEVEHVIQQFDT